MSARLDDLLHVLLLARHGCLVVGIAFDIGARHPRPGAAEPAHARAHIEEERLALLFAVVADVDAGFALLAHDVLPARRARLRQARHRPVRRGPSRYRAAPAPPAAAGCRCAWSGCVCRCVAWRFLAPFVGPGPLSRTRPCHCEERSGPGVIREAIATEYACGEIGRVYRYASTSGARPIAVIVAGPSCPSGCSPRPRWKFSIATCVPLAPHAVDRTAIEAQRPQPRLHRPHRRLAADGPPAAAGGAGAVTGVGQQCLGVEAERRRRRLIELPGHLQLVRLLEALQRRLAVRAPDAVDPASCRRRPGAACPARSAPPAPAPAARRPAAAASAAPRRAGRTRAASPRLPARIAGYRMDAFLLPFGTENVEQAERFSGLPAARPPTIARSGPRRRRSAAPSRRRTGSSPRPPACRPGAGRTSGSGSRAAPRRSRTCSRSRPGARRRHASACGPRHGRASRPARRASPPRLPPGGGRTRRRARGRRWRSRRCASRCRAARRHPRRRPRTRRWTTTGSPRRSARPDGGPRGARGSYRAGYRDRCCARPPRAPPRSRWHRPAGRGDRDHVRRSSTAAKNPSVPWRAGVSDEDIPSEQKPGWRLRKAVT